jgi:hypothetical protein
VAAVADAAGDRVRSYVVLDEGVLDQSEVAAGVFVDITRRFAEKFGTVHGSMLLIRPDGYLAMHCVQGATQSAVDLGERFPESR